MEGQPSGELSFRDEFSALLKSNKQERDDMAARHRKSLVELAERHRDDPDAQHWLQNFGGQAVREAAREPNSS